MRSTAPPSGVTRIGSNVMYKVAVPFSRFVYGLCGAFGRACVAVEKLRNSAPTLWRHNVPHMSPLALAQKKRNFSVIFSFLIRPVIVPRSYPSFLGWSR